MPESLLHLSQGEQSQIVPHFQERLAAEFGVGHGRIGISEDGELR